MPYNFQDGPIFPGCTNQAFAMPAQSVNDINSLYNWPIMCITGPSSWVVRSGTNYQSKYLLLQPGEIVFKHLLKE